VDPGVGTDRKALLVRTKNYYFIGPDNGVLFPSIREDGIEKIISIENNKFFLKKRASSTFHGRDIFAPVAAFKSLGVKDEVFGKEIGEEQIAKLEFEHRITRGRVCGKVINIDRFGDTATSIPAQLVKTSRVRVVAKGRVFDIPRVTTFSYGRPGEMIAYENGYGFLEIGINMGNLTDQLNLSEGDEICLEGFTQGDFSHST